METLSLRNTLEALLLVSDKPLTVETVKEVSNAGPAEIRAAFEELKREYDEQSRGIRVRELAGGYQMVTDPQLSDVVRQYIQSKDKKRLSQAGLEALAIIAYRQPITKAEIEFVRGVNVDGSLKTLLEKGLIRIAGRKEVPGRPILYATTKDFLDHFGLGSLKDLPKLAEFTEKDIQLPETMQSQTETAEESKDGGAEAGPSEPAESQADAGGGRLAGEEAPNEGT